MKVSYSGRWLLILIVSLLFAADVHAATRLALVSGSETKSLDPILVLAAADLGKDSDLQLLERNEIDRVLAEQKLALTAFAGGNQAVTVGKLLGVQLFAVLEATADGKSAAGLVTFDAETGVRLADVTIVQTGAEAQASEVAKAVRAAAGKSRAIASQKTVCILTVRNVDLPRELDGDCDAAGRLLQRLLLGRSGIVLLERERLDQVNKERQLPEAEGRHDLIASLVVVELEIQRAKDGKGVVATGRLSDGHGKEISKIATDATAMDAAALAEAIDAKLAAALGAAAAGSVQDEGWRKVEASRFDAERSFWEKHREYGRAMVAAEAALALSPDDLALQSTLIRSLLDRATDLIKALHPGTNRGADPIQPSPEVLHQAIALGVRGSDMTVNLTRTISQQKASDVSLFYHVPWGPQWDFVQFLTGEGLQLDEDRAGRDTILANNRWLQKTIADRELELIKDPRKFDECSQHLHLCYMALFYYGSADAKIRSADVLDLATRWLDVFGRSPHQRLYASRDMLRLLATASQGTQPFPGIQLDPLWDVMDHHADLRVQAYGKLGRAFLNRQPRDKQKPSSLQSVRLFAQDCISKLDAKAPNDMRGVLYMAAYDSVVCEMSTPDFIPDLTALEDFMFSRGELVTEVPEFLYTNFYNFNQAGAASGALALKTCDRVLDLLNDEHCQIVYNTEVGDQRAIWTGRRMDVLHKYPQLGLQISTPWTKATKLIDVLNETSGILWLYDPVIRRRDLYVPAMGCDNHSTTGNYLQLLKFNLDSGKMTALARIEVKSGENYFLPCRYSGAKYQFVTCACDGDDKIYLGTRDQGIYIFDDAGNAVPRQLDLKAGLPSDQVQSMAYVDGKLYAAVGKQDVEAYLMSYAVKEKQLTALVSSRRAQPTHPWEGRGPFAVPYLVADPANHRAVLAAYVPPSATWDLGGIWQIDAKTDKMTHLLNLVVGRGDGILWGSAIRDHHLILTTSDFSFANSGTIWFDLTNNDPLQLCRGHDCFVQPQKPPAATTRAATTQSATTRPGAEAAEHPEKFKTAELKPPFMLLDGWLWTASPFGRVSLIEKNSEDFPNLRGGSEKFIPNGCLAVTDDGKTIVVDDCFGIWLLQMPDHSQPASRPSGVSSQNESPK